MQMTEIYFDIGKDKYLLKYDKSDRDEVPKIIKEIVEKRIGKSRASKGKPFDPGELFRLS